MHEFPNYLDPSLLLGPSTVGGTTEVRAIMALSINGSVAGVEGKSGSLGNETDRDLLAGLRQWSDVIVVGGQTMRAEAYGPVHSDEKYAQARLQAGQDPIPRIAVVSRSLEFDVDSAFFTQATTPPIILTPQSTVESADLAIKISALHAAGAEVVAAGDTSPSDIASALETLGLRRIALEGGPTLYSQFLAAELVDVLYVTTSPQVIVPVTAPPFPAPETHREADQSPVSHHFTLASLQATSDGHIFARYERPTP